jgi:hypothetical protein
MVQDNGMSSRSGDIDEELPPEVEAVMLDVIDWLLQNHDFEATDGRASGVVNMDSQIVELNSDDGTIARLSFSQESPGECNLREIDSERDE